MPNVDRSIAVDALPAAARAISPQAWLVTAVLAVAMVALNHDFDVVGGRLEETVTSGGQLDKHADAEKEVAGGTMLRKLGLLLLLAAAGLSLFGPKANPGLQIGALPVLAAAILCWTAGSMLWSAEPTRSLREIVRLAAYAFTGVVLVRRFHVQELVWMFLVVSAVAIGVDVASDIGAGTFRPWTSEFRLGGALHPNHVGRLGAIVAMIGYAATWERRYRAWAWLIFAAGVLVVVMSVSRSGLVGLLAGMAAISFLGMSGRRFVFHAMALMAALGVGLGLYAISPTSLRHQVLEAALMGRSEDASSFTGRVPLWQEMWKDGAGRRLQGFGYGGYWSVERNYELGPVIEWYPTHSHSVYMELLIDLGLVGLLLCVATALVSTAKYSRLVAQTGRFEYRLLGALFVCGLANGLFEVSFIWPRLEGLFLGMAVLFLFMKQPEAKSATAQNTAAVTYSPTHLLTYSPTTSPTP
jgi:O-antigen ligase